ncbi:MAG TPA: GvpL/GvpF family gas vesicle protein [Pyrinomonadaceae bacterium]|nr:GvpL/GvpF family gas vesicle protein [Pyrinomonadaceae bacterium]
MKLYAYCLADDIDVLEEPASGISGTPVRLLKTEGFSVLVSDLDADVVQVTRENALAHAAVVRSILDRTTPLPFRFGTLVTEQQLVNYLSARKPALETKLAEVRGCVEMSVKIIREPAAHESEPDENINQGAGTSFLAQKRREILGGEQSAAQATTISTWLHEQISSLIRAEQVTLRPTEKLVLAAAHLVERAKVKKYRENMAEACQSRPDLHFLLSGPWPPYSFANIELEFKTQFGVS